MTRPTSAKRIAAPRRSRAWRLTSSLALLALCGQALLAGRAGGQLPEDIQRELNQNLAEQARIQAQRARHQQLIAARAGGQPAAGGKAPAAGGAPATTSAGQPQQAHDPNNYSYQQVSPPVQYSYYQPYGDLAKPQQPTAAAPAAGGAGAANTKPINIDLNNLNFDELTNLPAPQAQTAPASRADGAPASYLAGAPQRQTHLAPSFTGAGGLPVLQPLAAANQAPDTFAPAGKAPLPPQAQQGPPLTEADFKDITGGENYGAPGGSDFGMGAGSGGGGGGSGGEQGAEPRQDDDAQLREFGMPDQQQQQQPAAANQRGDEQMQGLGMANDFGNFNPMAAGGGAPSGRRSSGSAGGFDPFSAAGGMPGFGDFGNLAGAGGGGGGGQRRRQPAGEDFDFASQPSSRSQGGGGGADPAQATLNGAAPGSLQSLLGNAFPGLGGNMGLDGLARGGGQGGQGGQGGGDQSLDAPLDSSQRQQRADDGSLDIADLGERADGFGGADLGGFEQPSPQNDQDYNYAAAAEQQPTSVPYPDGGPQFVGSLWALTQPQSLTQTRYHAQPDHGTYQDYPAYKAGGNDFSAVRAVVAATPRARPPGAGRYGRPSSSELAPEFRQLDARMDYSQPPRESLGASASGASGASGDNTIDEAGRGENRAATSTSADFDDDDFI